MKSKEVGLVLSAGGAVGWPQIGVVQQLLEWKVPIDVVVGVSVGAFWGAAIASGMPISEIIEKGREYKGRDFKTPNLDTKCGLFDPQRVMKKWRQDCGDLQFEDLPRRLGIVATDFETGEEVVLTSGSVARAVQASFADPPLLKPVEMEGRILVEGALVNPLPVDVAYRLGADVVIAIDGIGEKFGEFRSARESPTRLERKLISMFPRPVLQVVLQRSGIFESLARRVAITMVEIKESKLKLYPPDVLIFLDRSRVNRWDYFDSSDNQTISQLIEEGKKAAILQKEKILKVLERS